MNVYYFLTDLINLIMGKRLIIKGADFSKNGIQYSLTWYSNNVFDSKLLSAGLLFYGGAKTSWDWNNKIFSGYSLHTQYTNKPVNIVRIALPEQVKNIPYITKLEYSVWLMTGTAYDTVYSSLENLKTFSISKDDIDNKSILEIRLPKTIVLPNSGLAGLSIGVKMSGITDSEALADLEKQALKMPIIGNGLSSRQCDYVTGGAKEYKAFTGAGIAMDYGYEQ